jgi:hypothetical protein
LQSGSRKKFPKSSAVRWCSGGILTAGTASPRPWGHDRYKAALSSFSEISCEKNCSGSDAGGFRESRSSSRGQFSQVLGGEPLQSRVGIDRARQQLALFFLHAQHSFFNRVASDELD